MFKAVGPLVATALLGAAAAPAAAALPSEAPPPVARGTSLLSATANERALTLQLACSDSGKVSVATGAPQQRLSSRFVCRDGQALVRLRMSARTGGRATVKGVATVLSAGKRSRFELSAPVGARKPKSPPVATAAWYDNYGGWHNTGNLSFVRRWPYQGYYTDAGRYYYFNQYHDTWAYNIVTLYGYWLWTGSAWRFWGDYQCSGMNLLASDTCTWFPAR